MQLLPHFEVWSYRACQPLQMWQMSHFCEIHSLSYEASKFFAMLSLCVFFGCYFAPGANIVPPIAYKIQGSKVQGSFIIRHIHNHTSIISSEMQVELKKNSIYMRKVRRKKKLPDYAPWGVQCENRKNTSATQKYIHDIATGEVNPAQQAAI